MRIVAESEYRLVILRYGRMRVPGVVFATRALIPDPAADRALEQMVSVAELPGIVVVSYAMPGCWSCARSSATGTTVRSP